MIALPPRYKRLIAKTMREKGPRAVIQSMTEVMLPANPENLDAMLAIERMHATLVEILKHWPENHRFTPADHER